MNAHQIRNVLFNEATELRVKGNNPASHALRGFLDNATDAELIRFRELIIGLPDLKLPHAATE